jgi:hypothetical protein
MDASAARPLRQSTHVGQCWSGRFRQRREYREIAHDSTLTLNEQEGCPIGIDHQAFQSALSLLDVTPCL